MRNPAYVLAEISTLRCVYMSNWQGCSTRWVRQYAARGVRPASFLPIVIFFRKRGTRPLLCFSHLPISCFILMLIGMFLEIRRYDQPLAPTSWAKQIKNPISIAAVYDSRIVAGAIAPNKTGEYFNSLFEWCFHVTQAPQPSESEEVRHDRLIIIWLMYWPPP